jgi:hypothetical protein
MGVSLTSFSVPDNGISQENEFVFNGGFEFFDLIDELKVCLSKAA